MAKSGRLRNPDPVRIRRGQIPRPNGITRLGEVVEQLMANRISPQHVEFELITELWSRLLPVELCRHCEITDLSCGQLRVLVDSPVYAGELRLCSSRLLEELRQRCPRARITSLKLVVGRVTS